MIKSEFASADRSPDDIVFEQYQTFALYPMLETLLGKIDQYLIILNENRQVVFTNNSFLNDFSFNSLEEVIGRRVGELLDCRFAWNVCGCGTSEFCKECGAVVSILKSQKHQKDVYMECVILTKLSGTLELAVSSKHIAIDGEDFTIFSVANIAGEKQSKVIEDIFYHDITNVASGIHSMVQLLSDDRLKEKSKVQAQLERCSAELIEELYSHKLLKDAERKDLQVKVSQENSIDMISKASEFVERIHSARGIILYLHHCSEDFTLKTDRGLLSRVLINMLTNAVEASSFSEKVTIGAKIENGEKVFWVHNPSYMPPEIQAKVFRQKFSTKWRNSGFGTYSIRLITEGYLNGRVDFQSDKKEGTVFSVRLKA